MTIFSLHDYSLCYVSCMNAQYAIKYVHDREIDNESIFPFFYAYLKDMFLLMLESQIQKIMYDVRI